MKKYYTIWAMVICALLIGCSNEDEPTITALKVVSNTAKFDAFGGEGKIEVQSASDITAVADDDWCTVNVSGHTVVVTVPVNATLVGRNTMVTIASDGQSLRVPVYQAGDAVVCDLSDYLFLAEGGTCSFSLKTTRECTVGKLPEWLTYKIADDKIVFTASAAEIDRTAQVTITCGKSTSITATFSQWAIMDVEGTYTVSFKNSSDVVTTGKATISKNEDGTYNMVTQRMVLNTTIKAGFSTETRLLTVSCGQLLGYANGYAAYLCAYSEDTYLSWDTKIQYVATGVFDENGKVKFVFGDNGTWPGKTVIGFYYAAFDKPVGDGGTYQKQTWGRATDIVMVKQ